MKRYYCKKCETEFVSDNLTKYVNTDCCPVCETFKTNEGGTLETIPVYETIAQWEARRGREYPREAPVFFYSFAGCWILGFANRPNESVCAKCVVATEAGAPPDDWSSDTPFLAGLEGV
jgi:hypothetical protein